MPDAATGSELQAAQRLLEAGQAAAAAPLLEALLSRQPYEAQAWLLLGQARGMQDQDAGAEQAFREAARLAPERHEAQFNLALALMYQQRLAESVPFFQAARRLNPDIPGLDELFLKVLLKVLETEGDTPAAEGPPPAHISLPPLSRQPLVSVIVPTRNRPQLLKDALASILAQGYRHWEVIVVNDGGEPVTAVLDELRRGLPPQLQGALTELRAAAPGGPGRARNMGIAAASGEVIAFLDDDDLYRPQHLQTLVQSLTDGAHGACYTRSEAVMEQWSGGARQELSRGLAMADFHYGRAVLEVRNFIPIDNWGLRREVLAVAGGFDESLACAEDWELLLRLSVLTTFREIPEVTAEIRMRPAAGDSVSTRNRLRPVCETIYRRHAPSQPLVETARELYLRTLA